MRKAKLLLGICMLSMSATSFSKPIEGIEGMTNRSINGLSQRIQRLTEKLGQIAAPGTIPGSKSDQARYNQIATDRYQAQIAIEQLSVYQSTMKAQEGFDRWWDAFQKSNPDVYRVTVDVYNQIEDMITKHVLPPPGMSYGNLRDDLLKSALAQMATEKQNDATVEAAQKYLISHATEIARSETNKHTVAVKSYLVDSMTRLDLLTALFNYDLPTDSNFSVGELEFLLSKHNATPRTLSQNLDKELEAVMKYLDTSGDRSRIDQFASVEDFNWDTITVEQAEEFRSKLGIPKRQRWNNPALKNTNMLINSDATEIGLETYQIKTALELSREFDSRYAAVAQGEFFQRFLALAYARKAGAMDIVSKAQILKTAEQKFRQFQASPEIVDGVAQKLFALNDPTSEDYKKTSHYVRAGYRAGGLENAKGINEINQCLKLF